MSQADDLPGAGRPADTRGETASDRVLAEASDAARPLDAAPTEQDGADLPRDAAPDAEPAAGARDDAGEHRGRTAWFSTVSSRSAYEGFVSVRVDTIRTPDGKEVDREVVERLDAVGVVPVTDDGRVLLVKHYRQPLGRYQLEIPAGILDLEGEAIEETAQRELAEELHHRARSLHHLGSVYTSAGWSDERVHLYLGRGLIATGPPEGFTAEAEESHLEVVPFTVADVLELARDGALTDAKTLMGILLAAPALQG
jgi:8-oxo-dGTP pyrophosphatase MutT (NUDIX family)